MLLRFSRLSFWLAAGVAAFALLAPGAHERLLAVIAGAACLLAVALLRLALRAAPPESDAPVAPAVVTPAPVLGEATLQDAAAQVLRSANAAGTFEAALHAVARLLRNELGARRVAVLAVHAVGARDAELSDLVESQPGFRTVPRRLRLDDAPLARVLRSGSEAADLPGSAALAVRAGGRVVAAIELGGIDLVVEPRALTGLLELAQSTLSEKACGMPGGLDASCERQFSRVSSGAPMLQTTGSGLPGDRERFRELGFDDHLSKPCRRDEMPAMLSKQLRAHEPAEAKDAAAAQAGPAHAEPVLDPTALARLAELDPKGENKLLERVLRAFQTSVARLRPQLDAARPGGDHAAIRLVAHTLKSSSASIGAMRLSQLCAQIETMIRLEAQDDLNGPLAELDAALDGALHAIDTLLKDRT